MKTMIKQVLRSLFFALLIPSTLSMCGRVLAYPLFVYNTSDSGPGSLRQAVADNNLFGGSNTIVFASGVTGVIALTSGELLVTNDSSIIGPGDKVLTVQGNNASRIFDVANASVNISGLAVANGSNALGGGILLQSGTLSLTRCTVIKNSAVNGGGIAQTNGTLVITDSTISSNKASNAGAGLYLAGATTTGLSRSTLAANYGSGFTTAGGGISYSGLSLTLDSCTFCDNGGLGNGGGLLNNSGDATVTSCTFSGNHAFQGGGIAVAGGAVVVQNSILAANLSNVTGAGAAPDCFGTIGSAGYNLVGNRTNSIGWGSTGDQLGSTATPINPMLAPLQDNGGPTWTMSLSNNSPAIDKGNSIGAATDQRGAPRPLDKPLIANATDGDGSDIGAYEAGTRTITVANLNASGPGSLQQAVYDAAPEDVTTIAFAPGLAGTIYTSPGLNLNKNLVINGPGASVLALSGNSQYRVLLVYDAPVSISGLTIKDGAVLGEDGEAEANGGSVSGGGIINHTNLSLTDCVISNNLAKGGAGGSTSGGTAGNGGDAFGAGIANLGTLTLTRCIVTGNKAFAGAPGAAMGGGTAGQSGSALGAGVYSQGYCTISTSTLSQNQVTGGIKTIGGPAAAGSAFYGEFFSSLYLFASTVASNSAYSGWWALYDLGDNGIIRNSTIAGNPSGGAYLSGANVGSSIIAANSDFSNVQGSMVSADFNLIGDTNGLQLTGGIDHTLFGQDPLLGPLQNNGGFTPTMALLAGSPALDRGASFGSLTDQRGRPRLFDFDAIPNALEASDIGAYELNPPILSFGRFGTNAYLSWTTNEPSFILEGTTNLGLPAAWVAVQGTRSVSESQFVVVDGLVSRKFYRLRGQ